MAKAASPEPVALEHRAQGFYLPREYRGRQHYQKDHRHDERSQKTYPVTVFNIEK
jgi:hypothetical protein